MSRYTDEIGRQMRAAYERGASPEALGGLHGVSRGTARNWLIRAGAELRGVRQKREPAPPSVASPRPSAGGGATFVPTLQRDRGAGFNKAATVRTICKICRGGIRDGDDTTWRTSTPLGLAHTPCSP